MSFCDEAVEMGEEKMKRKIKHIETTINECG
jgi:hypothetical protein